MNPAIKAAGGVESFMTRTSTVTVTRHVARHGGSLPRRKFPKFTYGTDIIIANLACAVPAFEV